MGGGNKGVGDRTRRGNFFWSRGRRPELEMCAWGDSEGASSLKLNDRFGDLNQRRAEQAKGGGSNASSSCFLPCFRTLLQQVSDRHHLQEHPINYIAFLRFRGKELPAGTCSGLVKNCISITFQSGLMQIFTTVDRQDLSLPRHTSL